MANKKQTTKKSFFEILTENHKAIKNSIKKLKEKKLKSVERRNKLKKK